VSIVLIYHHEERARADGLRALLEQKGYAVKLAPLGYEVGSPQWQAGAKADIEGSKLVLALVTRKASDEEWFNWRIQAALDAGKRLVPLMLENGPPPAVLRMYQAAYMSPEDDEAIVAIVGNMGIQPETRCFMSYARADSDFAAKLAASLRDAKLQVWRDVDNIPAGASWDAEIQKALNECTHLLLVATPESVQSPNVADEISFALNKGKTVIPIILKPCELPLRIHRAQWVDFQVNYEDAVKRLLEHLVG
jgi:hypothetical protein